MPGKIEVCPIFILLGIPMILEAQQPATGYLDLEDMLYRSESAFIPETLIADEDESEFRLLDLNSSSPEELEASGLFTPYQVHNLIKYREEYGEFFSIYEIVSLPGFRPSDLPQIESYMTTDHANTKSRKKSPQHMLLVDLGRTLPVSGGTQDESDRGNETTFSGSPLKTTLRYRSNPLNRLSVALTYEKDGGEEFLYQNKPQFLSGFICYSGEGVFRKLVVGDFKMNHGMGLVNGAGFLHQAGKLRVSRLSLSQITPYASKTENMFEQGAACRLEIKKTEFMLWTSYRCLSLSPSAFTENEEADKWLDYERTSGLYRTPGELEGRELAFRIHSGIQALYRFRQLTIGMMGGAEKIFPTRKARENFTIHTASSLQQKTSLHANWQKNQIQIFGELATSNYRYLAWLFGTKCYFGDFITGSLLIHSYGNSYRGSYPSSYGSGSTIQNEQGVTSYMRVETGKFVTAELTVGLFRYPFPRHLTTVPSGGYKLDLSLYNPGNRMLQWRLRVVSKTWQTTPATEISRLRPLQDSRVTRFDGQMTYSYLDLFRWQSRLVISYYSGQTDHYPGFAAMQKITIGSSRILKATVQFVLFNVADWENRIYMYEPGFYYNFSFPSYYGKGQKTTLLLTMKPMRRITLSAKISGGLNSGNRKWETGIQLRLNL